MKMILNECRQFIKDNGWSGFLIVLGLLVAAVVGLSWGLLHYR